MVVRMVPQHPQVLPLVLGHEAKWGETKSNCSSPCETQISGFERIETLGAWQLLGYSPWNLEAILIQIRESLCMTHLAWNLKGAWHSCQGSDSSFWILACTSRRACWAASRDVWTSRDVTNRHDFTSLSWSSISHRPCRGTCGRKCRNDASNVCIRPSSVSKSRASSLAMHCSKSASACHAKNASCQASKRC